VPKAIVILGSGVGVTGGNSASHILHLRSKRGSLANLDVLGDSLIGRVADELKRGGIESVTVFSEDPLGHDGLDVRVKGYSPEDLWPAVSRELLACRDSGTDTVLIMRLGPYAELDVADMLQYRADRDAAVVRGFDQQGALDIWVVDPDRICGDAEAADTASLPAQLSREAVVYEVRGYVNALEHPRDLRRLAVDGLNLRCRLRPRGFEVRPGVWMAEGAQIERGSRLVAPAFIGKNVCVSQQGLVTRGSSIECNSVVDYGTVIENTSILPNTYVGIGLDVCHSIVDGNRLLNLHRDVLLEIEDSAVIRQNKPLEEAACRWWSGLVTNEPITPVADESAN
jgi:hypothetical protein